MKLVDWDTIIIYTCTNYDCFPDFDKDQYYLPEFAHIQFSEDFSQVRLGDELEIEEQKKLIKKTFEEEMEKIEAEQDGESVADDSDDESN